jgi:hypothetical protein
MKNIDLNQYGLSGPTILTNLSNAALYEEAVRYDQGTCISSTGEPWLLTPEAKLADHLRTKGSSSKSRHRTTSGGDR